MEVTKRFCDHCGKEIPAGVMALDKFREAQRTGRHLAAPASASLTIYVASSWRLCIPPHKHDFHLCDRCREEMLKFVAEFFRFDVGTKSLDDVSFERISKEMSD